MWSDIQESFLFYFLDWRVLFNHPVPKGLDLFALPLDCDRMFYDGF